MKRRLRVGFFLGGGEEHYQWIFIFYGRNFPNMFYDFHLSRPLHSQTIIKLIEFSLLFFYIFGRNEFSYLLELSLDFFFILSSNSLMDAKLLLIASLLRILEYRKSPRTTVAGATRTASCVGTSPDDWSDADLAIAIPWFSLPAPAWSAKRSPCWDAIGRSEPAALRQCALAF